MSSINWIYIIDNTGAPIFTHEAYLEGSENAKNALTSHFIYGLQMIASQLETDEFRVIEIGNENYLLTRNTVIDYRYIIKIIKNVEQEEIKSILNEIKTLFIKNFENQLNLSIEMRVKIISSLRNDLIKILKTKDNLKNFM